MNHPPGKQLPVASAHYHRVKAKLAFSQWRSAGYRLPLVAWIAHALLNPETRISAFVSGKPEGFGPRSLLINVVFGSGEEK